MRPFISNVRIITQADTVSIMTAMTPYIHGMEMSGNRKLVSASAQRPEESVAPLLKRYSSSSALTNLFVKAYRFAARPNTNPVISGSLYSSVSAIKRVHMR